MQEAWFYEHQLENNFIMDYNQFSYYRSNPYAHNHFMPPAAHVNRHRPEFLTEMPSGEEYFNKIGRRQYSNGARQSHIDKDNLLKSPQRYPYENRIALEKTYDRNLNTIDIEGASSNTLINPSIRNKMKARQQLIKHNKIQRNQKEWQAQFQSTEQQRRRQIAHQQYLKNAERDSNNSHKFVSPHQNNFLQSNHRHHQNQEDNMSLIKKRNLEKELPFENLSKEIRGNFENQAQLMPRFQSIETVRRNYNPQIETNALLHKKKQSESSMTHSQPVRSEQAEYRLPMPKDQRQLRLQNPTHLSSESAIFLAGRNLIGNGS